MAPGLSTAGGVAASVGVRDVPGWPKPGDEEGSAVGAGPVPGVVRDWEPGGIVLVGCAAFEVCTP